MTNAAKFSWQEETKESQFKNNQRDHDSHLMIQKVSSVAHHWHHLSSFICFKLLKSIFLSQKMDQMIFCM